MVDARVRDMMLPVDDFVKVRIEVCVDVVDSSEKPEELLLMGFISRKKSWPRSSFYRKKERGY